MKTATKSLVTALGIVSIVALGACQSKQADKVENAYDNNAAMVDNQADNVAAMSDNLTGNAAVAADNLSDALKDKADATRKVGDAAAKEVDNKM